MYSPHPWPDKTQTLLLQAALFEDPLAQEAWEKWSQTIDFDAIDPASYKLLPLVSRNLALRDLQDPLFEKCKGVYRHVWVENQLLWERTRPFLEELIKKGVDKVVLLKGMAMIHHYYRDFGVRVIGDIDILIKRKQVARAYSILSDSGWDVEFARFDITNAEHLKRWNALNLKHSAGMNLDLHWSLLKENSQDTDEEVLLNSQLISIKNFQLYIPNPTDLLLITCLHGMKYSPVPLIRWIADAMTLLKRSKNEIKWDRLADMAHKARVGLPLSLALHYLIEEFRAPIPLEAISQLKKVPSLRLEQLEYRFNNQGRFFFSTWCRYCLNQGHLTLWSQILNTHQYIRITARLKSSWLIPFFALYWFPKQLYKRLKFYLLKDG